MTDCFYVSAYQTTLGGLLYILLQILCIGHQRKSVKNYEHWLTLGKVIATFLLVHFVLPILSNPALTPLQKRPFQQATIRHFNVDS